jgi:streptogramin lyase
VASKKEREAEQRKRVVAWFTAFWALVLAAGTVLGLISYLSDPELWFWVFFGLAIFSLAGAWGAYHLEIHPLFKLFGRGFVVALLLAIGIEGIDPASPSPLESGEYAPEPVDKVVTGNRPRSIAAGDKYVWAVGLHNAKTVGKLWRIDPAHLRADAEEIDSFEATDPFDIAIGEEAIWVTDPGYLIKLDLNGQELWRKAIGNDAYNEVDVGLGYVWFKQTAPGVLFRLDPDSGKKEGRIEIGPEAVALGVGQDAVWVTKKGEEKSRLIRVDRHARVAGRIEVQHDPQDVTAGDRLVYVAHAQGNMLTRVDPGQGKGGRELPGEQPLRGGALPSGLDAGEGTVWVSFSNSGNVFAVGDCNWEVLGKEPSGAEPLDVVVHEGMAFVPNFAGGTVSVFELKREACLSGS